MKSVLRMLTPPEWGEWRWLARLVYLAVFAGIMGPVIMLARWLSSALFG